MQENKTERHYTDIGLVFRTSKPRLKLSLREMHEANYIITFNDEIIKNRGGLSLNEIKQAINLEITRLESNNVNSQYCQKCNSFNEYWDVSNGLYTCYSCRN